MPAKKPARAKVVWRPSDIAKATAAAASSGKAEARRAHRADAADVDAQEATPTDRERILDIGAQAIYGWRKGRGTPWASSDHQTRSAYRAQMQEMLNELAAKGFVIEARSSPHALNAKLTPAEARKLRASVIAR